MLEDLYEAPLPPDLVLEGELHVGDIISPADMPGVSIYFYETMGLMMVLAKENHAEGVYLVTVITSDGTLDVICEPGYRLVSRLPFAKVEGTCTTQTSR